MNFRELFSKLDELMVPGDDQPMADKMGKTDPMSKPEVPAQDMQKPIPGAQPQLGAKPTMVAPAVPFGNKEPEPQAVPDPKSDINAMARALQVMAMQNKQSPANIGMQSTPTSAEKAMPVGTQSKQTIGRPGEPLEEKSEPKGDTSRIWLDRKLRPGKTVDNWIADIKKDPKAYYSITDPKEREAVRKIINDGDADLINKIKAANPNAPAPAPVTDPKATATDPKATATDPKATATDPKATATDPKATATDPKATATDPKATATDPKATATDPKATATDPKGPETSAKEKPPVKAGDGPTGLALAKLGITRDQRRNQEFVDKTLGAGKFTAGTAASNLALLAAAEENARNPAAPAPAAVAASPAVDAAAPAASGDGQGPKPNGAGVVPQASVQGSPTATSVAPAPAPAPAAVPVNAEDEQAKFDRLAAVAREREQTANAKAYIDNLRKEYGNKDGNFMRSTGAQAIDPEGNPVYWKRGNTGTDGSWEKLPSYHPATRQGWYSPELVDALKRTGAVPSDDKFAPDKRSWYEKPFKDAEGSIKLNLKEPAATTTTAPVSRSVALGRAAPKPDGSPQTITVSDNGGKPDTSAKEGPVDRTNPAVKDALGANRNGAQESSDWPMKTINGVRTFDPLNIGRSDPKENIELHEMSTQLNLLAEELTEWSMSDRIHKDVPYSYSDAATDAGIAGLGALATYATGGLAAPIAGAATVARGGRLANMLNKAYQGSKNVAKGAKEIATNPEVRAVANKNLPGVAATGVKTGTASAGVTTGLNAASDALDETNVDNTTTELERIKKLSKG